MTRKRWAELRDMYADTPEQREAHEKARQCLEDELADYADRLKDAKHAAPEQEEKSGES
jgi:hypothetical protein